MMQEENNIIGQELALGMISNCLSNLNKGKGSIVALSGNSGLGKSYILSEYADSTTENQNIESVFVQCQPPIGNVTIGNLQPLLPFQKITEKIEEKKQKTAGKKFAFDVGMTTLSAVPIGGELFYWVKEVHKAFETYKKEKKQEVNRSLSIGAEFYYDAIVKSLEKKKLAIFIDDLHWSDSQTIELLGYFLERIETIPIMFVFSFNKSILETTAAPLSLFLEKYSDSKYLFPADLESFTLPDIRNAARFYFPGYTGINEFEDWIFQKSYGIPATIFEYLKYFQKNNPFTPEGLLSENFGSNSFLPVNVQSAFSETIEKLSEDERNILAICSAEGREFSALVISQLLNADVLTTIKKLRSLQNKSRIIKSIGAKVRYGQTTTVYEFTQAFYQSFFENSLEYEEKVALHGHIASILKKKFEEADSESVKQQLAPYVAAHSSAAGDDETAKQMLLVTAQAAKEYGSVEIMQQAYDSYLKLQNKTGKPEEDNITAENIAFKELLRGAALPNIYIGNDEQLEDVKEKAHFIDFISLRRIVVDDFLKGEFAAAADKALTYFNSRETELRLIEQAQLLSIAVRSYVELKDPSSAETYLKKSLNLTGLKSDPIAESFVNNAAALYYYHLNKIEEASSYLQKAAQRALHLPPEIRLMTISNIALIQQNSSPEKAKKYYNAIKKLSSHLNFSELSSDIFKN